MFSLFPKRTAVSHTPRPAPHPKSPRVIGKTNPIVSTLQGISKAQTTAIAANAAANAARSLFAEGGAYLSPGQIRAILQTCGVKVNKDQAIALDTAQIIIAGGAITTAAESAASWQSYCNPISASAHAAIDILQLTGAINANDPNVILLQSGLDVGMLIGSCGANVGAWIDLASNLYHLDQVVGSDALKAKSTQQANQAIQQIVQAREQSQYSALMSNLADYQKGQVDTFDFIDQVASQSPDYFKKTFPNFAPYFEDNTVTYSVEVKNTDSFCGVSTGVAGVGNASYTLHTTNYVRSQLQTIMYACLVRPVVAPFEIFEKENPKLMTINDLAVLSMVPPYLSYVPENFDIVSYLQQANITPRDLGYGFIETLIKTNSIYQANQDFEPPIVFGGLAWRDPVTQRQYDNTLTYQADIDQITLADQSGNMDYLLSLDNIANQIRSWASITTPAVQNYYERYGNNLDVKVLGESPNLWRYPQQYVKALSVVDQMSKSKILHNFASEFDTYLSKLDEFKSVHKALTLKSAARAANRRAHAIIASFFGTTPDKMERVTDLTPGQPAIFRVKR